MMAWTFVGGLAYVAVKLGAGYYEHQQVLTVYNQSSSDAEFLANLFTADNLWGKTPQGRLRAILEGTRSIPVLTGSDGLGYFRGDFGESGFQEILQDGELYDMYWGGGKSDQVGHFLTSVGLAFYYGKASLYPSVGHEMLSDETGIIKQIGAAIQDHGNIDLFLAAVGADARGNTALRDQKLRAILASGYAKDKSLYYGNSLQDLRLNVRGWRLAQLIKNGTLQTREEVATWIQENIGQ
jgi:hypothetical protein